ncbi:cupin domain-containing protein [Actinomadura harenae]|uniref:Uncharacterized protein n=1 Tax=Actinomadura harenae TaxID=2483351 RepID=A0A3M2LX44_9ACTN|nr:hypothetical protein [Actinomadura harenae]RMI41782.1 hypothetical protein EBO15_21800 [Actinomadura harenae]
MPKKVAALAAATIAIAGLAAAPPASASSPKPKTASPSYVRVACYGPFIKWPVKIVHYSWNDQCFQFPHGGGETLHSNDHYDEVWSGGYRITVYYAGRSAHSMNPGERYVVPGGLLQKIVVIG